MAKSSLTVRMDEGRLQALDKVAEAIGRDRPYVVTQAIDALLDVQRWQKEYIEAALRDADAGRLASTAEAGRTFTRLRGRPRERKTA